MLYKKLATLYEKLEGTSKRLEKTYYLSEFLKKTEKSDIEKIILLIQGRLFPPWDTKELGIAANLMVKTISISTGISLKKIKEEWKNTGDLGNVAQNKFSKKKQQSLFKKPLKVNKVFSNLRKLPDIEGKGAQDKKIQYISELLIQAEPLEAKYIVRTILSDLRIGIGQGTLRDAIAWAYFKEELNLKYKDGELEIDKEEREKYNDYLEKIQHAYNMTNEFSVVIKVIEKQGIKGLDDIRLRVKTPVKMMLFQKAENIDDAFETVGRPAAFEYKYDGFRIQAHKDDKEVILFTRRLEDVTRQFPEIVKYINEYVNAKSAIFDCEVVGYDPQTGNYLPFQSISQRIKRKYDVKKLSKEYPVEVNVFDILFLDGISLLKEPFKKRRELLEKTIQEKPKQIVLAKQIITGDKDEAQEFYSESLKRGEEGMMAKNLSAEYKAGSRVGYGVKVKPVMEPLDLVIVKAEYGEGKRSGWLTSYTLACRDSSTGTLLEIGKVSTGLKELKGNGVSFQQMTNLLKPLITKSSGKIVKIKPEIVIEVNYEEIQKSPTYSSGYALRFPRFSRLRQEKPLDEINSLQDIKKLYKIQRGRL
ncbi:ATP-dependent DNA ligase [Candidatus Woesearchaeota archaeon]|nr:ATP-dependent DNA ligase [Candidatus Woesearchaeota archaeon]